MRAVFLFISLLAFANAATFFTVPTIPQVLVGAWTDWIFVTATAYPPNFTTTITIAASDPSVTISPSSLVFDADANPPIQSLSFKLSPTKVGNYVITFATSDVNFTVTPLQALLSVQRTVSVDRPTAVKVGLPSEPIKISLNFPSQDDLTVTPSSAEPSLVFNPTAIIIPAGSIAASFVYTANSAFASATIQYALTGNESALYGPIANSAVFQSQNRPINAPLFSQNVIVNNGSSELFVYTPDIVNGTLTITPAAADTIFTPTSADLTYPNQVVNFTFNTSSLQTARPVWFYLSGDGAAGYSSPTTTMSVPKRTFIVDAPTTYILTVPSKLAIRIPAPVASDVTVTLFAANLEFNPTSVTFTGSTTSISVDVTPTNLGSDSISFLVTGTDSEFYVTPTTVTVTISGGSFFSPLNWYIPSLWVGEESDPVPIWVNIPPSSNLTVTPSAPDLIFKPDVLHFDKNNIYKTFTITPLAASTTASETITTITFLLSGGDYSFFSVPSPTAQVTIQRRQIQVRWGSEFIDYEGDTDLNLYLKKQHYAWVTVNYISPVERITVTPVSPYLTFDPAKLQFSSGTTHIKLKATPIAAGQNGNIDYIIEGDHAGYYASIPSDSYSVNIRPLQLSTAVISFDERSQPVQITTDSPTPLADNHVFAFSLRSDVVPDGSVTITPVSPHVTFSPGSITLSPDTIKIEYDYPVPLNDVTQTTVVPYYYVEANFSVTGKSAGLHDVYFKLSGSDASYYDVPDHLQILFRTYNDKKPNPATRIMASFAAVFLGSLLLLL